MGTTIGVRRSDAQVGANDRLLGMLEDKLLTCSRNHGSCVRCVNSVMCRLYWDNAVATTIASYRVMKEKEYQRHVKFYDKIMGGK